jgi:hypothetical protein
MALERPASGGIQWDGPFLFRFCGPYPQTPNRLADGHIVA